MSARVHRQVVLWLGLLGLAGCGTPSSRPSGTAPAIGAPAKPAQTDAERQADFDRSMVRWHGAHVQELVKKQGAPSSQSRLPGGKLVYVYARSTQVRGPSGMVPFKCAVYYTVDERSSLITGHRIEGC